MNGEKNELRFMNGVCDGVKNIKIHRTSRAHIKIFDRINFLCD